MSPEMGGIFFFFRRQVKRQNLYLGKSQSKFKLKTRFMNSKHPRIFNIWLKVLIPVVIVVAMLAACNPQIADGVRKSDLKKDVQLQTQWGDIVLRLSDETPLHRDNFLRLVKAGALDSMDFYRVVNDFLIQTGKDFPAEKAELIPAEFRPGLFHKRGAVNAAREGDDVNPTQASANLHFTIVQGKVQTDSMLQRAEVRINQWRAFSRVINNPANADLFARFQKWSAEGANADSLVTVKGELDVLTKAELENGPKYEIPKEHREVYKNVGGAPHLDQNYTVFGEVLSGMDIVDRIAAVKVDESDKPYEPVYILKAVLIDRQK